MDAQCCMETKERWGEGIHHPGKQAWKSLSYLYKQLGMIRSRFFCNKIPSHFLTWKTQFIGQLTSIKTTREHETHHLFLLILFPFGWKFWSWEYKIPEFCYVLCLHEGIKTAVCGLKKYPLSGRELKQAVWAQPCSPGVLLPKWNTSSTKQICLQNYLPLLIAASGFHQAAPLSPGPQPRLRSGGSAVPARTEGARPRWPWCPFVRAVSRWAQTEPTTSTELSCPEGSKGPVLSQDASVWNLSKESQNKLHGKLLSVSWPPVHTPLFGMNGGGRALVKVAR